MIRALYSLVLWLAQPLLRRKLARRAVVEPLYAQDVPQRFGRFEVPAGEGYVWVHAVSLGETRAAGILIAQLRQQIPGMRLLLTHGTATGREEGQRLLREGDVQVWQPWDTHGSARRFLRHFRPSVGILMETEVWPNLVASCTALRVPLVLVNARMSEKSLRSARRLAWLARPAYAGLSAVFAQTSDDARRLKLLGANVQGVFGNLKFDATPDAGQIAQAARWRANCPRPVLVLASSREGEEAAFLDAWQRLEPGLRDRVQPMIVPRHPQRFEAVAALAQARGFDVQRRSAWGNAGPPASATDVLWLGDSLGEMALYYSLAGVALLGGSFEPLGGQNLIEAAACGCPVVMGPHTFNFTEAAALSLQAGAARRALDLADGLRQATDWVLDAPSSRAASEAALGFCSQHRGAAARTAQAVVALLARQADRPRP